MRSTIRSLRATSRSPKSRRRPTNAGVNIPASVREVATRVEETGEEEGKEGVARVVAMSVTRAGNEAATQIGEEGEQVTAEATTGEGKGIVQRCAVTVGSKIGFLLQTLPEILTDEYAPRPCNHRPSRTWALLLGLLHFFSPLVSSGDMAFPLDQANPAAPAPFSILDDDLSATLDALSLTQQDAPASSESRAAPLPPPIPLVRSTSDKRQAVPESSSQESTRSNLPLKSSFESPSGSPFPVTPTDPKLVKPVISPAPPSRRTCVILQEACQQHRYARNHDIGTIVERPERIRAVKTGIAAAWARLEARNVAHGGTRWQRPQAGQPAPQDAEAELESMMSGLGLKERNKDVIGGPFDVIYSTAVLPVDDPALQYIHPLPNVPPSPPPAPPRPPSPPPTSSRPTQTPSTSPSKQMPPSAPFSAPPKLPSRPPPLDIKLPWPQQLSSLCRNASAAISNPPYSEIPPHLPQGDLYLTEGSETAILGALGAVCEGVDKVLEGSRTGGIGYDRAFVAIRPPGHASFGILGGAPPIDLADMLVLRSALL